MSEDFSGQNLRGRSFKNRNLEGADFSNADIRGANFEGANLRGANFTGAKAGLQRRWSLLLVFLSLLLSAISSFFFTIDAYVLSGIYTSTDFNPFAVAKLIAFWIGIIITILSYTVLIRQGIRNFTFFIS